MSWVGAVVGESMSKWGGRDQLAPLRQACSGIEEQGGYRMLAGGKRCRGEARDVEGPEDPWRRKRGHGLPGTASAAGQVMHQLRFR